MGRNSKTFTQSTSEPRPYTKKLASEDPLFSVYRDLALRVERGKNFARKQENKKRLENFVLNLIHQKQQYERSQTEKRDTVEETDRLEHRITKLMRENDRLRNRNCELVKHNDSCRNSKLVYATQERSLSNVLQTEMRHNSKLVRENQELKELLKQN